MSMRIFFVGARTTFCAGFGVVRVCLFDVSQAGDIGQANAVQPQKSGLGFRVQGTGVRSEAVGAEASDMASVAGISERGEGVEVIDPTLEAPPLAFVPRATQHADAFASLDGVTLREVL